MTLTTEAATLAGAELEMLAPQLVDGYRAALPAAVDVVGRRLLAAAWREDIGAAREVLRKAPMRRYGFDRVEPTQPVTRHPASLLGDLGVCSPGLGAELADACVNLAIGYARRAGIDAELRATGAPDVYALAAGRGGDEQLHLFERLATEGHNLHPCGRTRLGWRVGDVLRHDQESPGTAVGFIAVRRDLHCGDDVGELLRDGYPQLPTPPPGYLLQPVHTWQLATVIPDRYPDLLADGALRMLDAPPLPATPTTALRTVLLAPDRAGIRRYLKLSLDIQVTSTRRTISVASTRNGPVIGELLRRLLADEGRALLLPEVAGAAVATADGRSRDMSVIVRHGLAGRLHPGEVAIPGAALPARSPLTGGTVLDEVVARYPGAALDFLEEYARLLLPPLLRLARAGIGLEAHLQNSIPTFVDGVPHRIAFRDFAGLRLHLTRLRERTGLDLSLWPGSVVGTEDINLMRAKLGYTALQAHLGELVLRLVEAHGVAEQAAWRRVRTVLDESRVDADDHAFLTAPVMPHKALVRMRLADRGDLYGSVQNPLHGS
jgi:siderophore synthetase component